MAGRNTAVFGICRNVHHLERTIDELRRVGFRSDDISTLFPDKGRSRDFAHERNTKAPEGAALGGGTGFVLGAAFGWLFGAGALAIPGLEPFVAAGPLLAAMAGAGIMSAFGGMTGALIGMGIPEFEAKRYQGLTVSGGILLSVHADNSEWARKAKGILNKCLVSEVSSAAEANADTQSPVGQPKHSAPRTL